MKIHIHVTESVNLANTADLIWLTETEMDEMPWLTVLTLIHDVVAFGLHVTLMQIQFLTK